MTTSKIASRAVNAAAPKAAKAKAAPVLFAGKGAAARGNALLQIAPLAYAEAVSRGASIANLAKVLGDKPSDAQLKAAGTEWIIGRVASRLPVSELLKGKTSPADRLERARDVVTRMAACPKEGVTTRPLRKGQIGHRTPVMQRVVRAAEEAKSLIFGEVGFGKARTLAEKNARQAAATAAKTVAAAVTTVTPSMAGSGKGKAKATAPVHAELVKPQAPVTPDDVVAFLSQLARTAKDYANKYAKQCPVDAGTAAQAFHGDMLKAANALQERKAIAEAAQAAKAAKAAKA